MAILTINHAFLSGFMKQAEKLRKQECYLEKRAYPGQDFLSGAGSSISDISSSISDTWSSLSPTTQNTLIGGGLGGGLGAAYGAYTSKDNKWLDALKYGAGGAVGGGGLGYLYSTVQDRINKANEASEQAQQAKRLQEKALQQQKGKEQSLAEQKAQQARDKEITRKGREAEQAREREREEKEYAASRSRSLQAKRLQEKALQQQKEKEQSLAEQKAQQARDKEITRKGREAEQAREREREREEYAALRSRSFQARKQEEAVRIQQHKAMQARDKEITRKGREAEQARKQEKAVGIQQQKVKKESLRQIKIQEAKDLDMQRQRQGLIPLNAGIVATNNGKVYSAKQIMADGEEWLEGTYKDKSFNEFIPGLPAIAKKKLESPRKEALSFFKSYQNYVGHFSHAYNNRFERKIQFSPEGRKMTQGLKIAVQRMQGHFKRYGK